MDPMTPSRSLSQHLSEVSSLSRAPSRRQQFTENEINPLLSNLSPTSTLEALKATDAVPTEERHRRSFIQDSVASASTSERAWGIKAALAAKKLREWHQELLAWSWPGYEVTVSEVEEFWGGLPARTAQQHEDRLEMIADDMETLEVDDLKDYVRSRHLGSQTRESAVTMASSDYEHLSDFAAIVTAMMVQALPTLSHLSTLLNIWTIRLSILRQVPSFLRNLADAKESMCSAWMAMGKSNKVEGKRRSLFSRQSFINIQAVLKDQIAQLGRLLDNMLDLLEGSGDVLPDAWIDTLDALENEYSLWVVRAEELVLENEMGCEGYRSRQTRKEADGTITQHGGAKIVECRDQYHSDTQFGDSLGVIDDKSSEDPSHPSITNTAQRGVENDEDFGMSKPSDLKPRSPLAENDAEIDDRTMESPLTQQERAQDRSTARISKAVHNKPAPLILTHSTQSSEIVESSDISSDMSETGSATSDYFSDKSSPEIRNASVIEFVSSPALVNSPWSSKEAAFPSSVPSRRSSVQTERGAGYTQVDGTVSPTNQRSRTSTIVPDTTTGLGIKLMDGRLEKPPSSISHARTRSASMQSIEVIPKNEIRKITIRRSVSYVSTPSEINQMGLEDKSDPDATHANHTAEAASKPSREPPSSETHTSSAPPMAEAVVDLERDFDAPGPESSLDTQPSAPLKAPNSLQGFSELDQGHSPVKAREEPAFSSVSGNENRSRVDVQTPVKTLPINSEDRLEARISSILTQIPTNIRLTSEPKLDASDPDYFTSAHKRYGDLSPAIHMTRAQTSVNTPTMTLAAAQPKSVRPRLSNAEPEIKLYHLHQPGKDVPIKLFVRLVGDTGERVMVRIGGGWADLAEYLKEYAGHHGRRSVSDTRFDIQGISSSPFSQASPSGRPTSPISTKLSPAVNFKRQQTTPGKVESPKTPASDPFVRSSSSMSWTEEDSPSLGLAGPKTKKVEISPRKQAWVDDMLEQARGGNGGPSMGHMGKVGGTKRVFLKGRSRAGSNV